MCWNEHVSLNTFLFSFFVLLLIIYNNAYTPYKIEFLSIPMCIFLASFIFMQLIEFFIWRNLHNSYNGVFSLMALLLIICQPLASLLMVKDTTLRNLLMMIYSSVIIIYYMLLKSKNIHSEVSKNGHLSWKFINDMVSSYSYIFWFFFFLFSFVYNKMWLYLAFIVLTYAMSVIHYAQYKTITSMWCWIANSQMIFFAIYLLLWLPYQEHGIC